jgi:hypothetical protein
MSDNNFSACIGRRDFIKLGSVAVGALAGAGYPVLAFGVGRASQIAAGFATSEPQENELVWLTGAARLLSGDPAFIGRDARVTIRSSTRAAAQNSKPGAAAIDVVFPVLGYQPEAYPSYRAWSWRNDANMGEASAPVSFRVPIDATNGLHLTFRRLELGAAEGGDGSTATAPDDVLRLGLDSVSSSPKLQRGLYVVAYGDRIVSNWSAVAITRRNGEIVVPDAKFSYVVLSIDYAT